MTVQERISKAINKYLVETKKKKVQLAKELGISQGRLTNYLKGVNVPGAKVLAKFSEISGIPLDDILKEKEIVADIKYHLDSGTRKLIQSLINMGPEKRQEVIEYLEEKNLIDKYQDIIYKEGEDVRVKNGKWVSGIAEPSPPSPDAYAYIPLYDIRASAGGGAFVEEENIKDVLAFKREWIHNELHASPAEIVLLFIEGESMSPTLNPGDIVLVKKQDNAPIRDGIYVVRLEDTLLVKRLQHLPGKVLKVSSDNPAYEPFSIGLADPHEDFAIIGRVVWAGRRF